MTGRGQSSKPVLYQPPYAFLSDFVGYTNSQLLMTKLIWDSERDWFVAEFMVNSPVGNKFMDQGIGRTKEGAKDAAARNVLKLMCPRADLLVAPPSEDELVGDIETPSAVVPPSPEIVHAGPEVAPDAVSSRTREVPERQGGNLLASVGLEQLTKGASALRISGEGGLGGAVGRVVRGAVRGSTREDGAVGSTASRGGRAVGSTASRGGFVGGAATKQPLNPESGGQLLASAQEEDGVLKVTVKLPIREGKAPPLKTPQTRFSLFNKIDCIRTWTGEKTLSLKASEQDIDKMEGDTAVLLASAIRKEQNLDYDFKIYHEKTDQGLIWSTYILDVFPLEIGEESSGVKQPPGLYFTEIGEGSSAQLAHNQAAKKFLIGIRSLMNSTE